MDKMLYVILPGLLAMTALQGCATSSQTYAPDGRPAYTINCSGSALSWDACYKKAGKLCAEKGYDILAQTGEQGSTLAAGQYGLYGGSVITRTLLIACKP